MYSNIGLIDLKGPLSAYDPDPVEAGAWISERQYVGLELPGELLTLEHLSLRLQVLEKHPLPAIDSLLSLHRVRLNNMRYVLDEHLFTDGVFLLK